MIREGEGLAVVAIHGNGVDHRILKADRPRVSGEHSFPGPEQAHCRGRAYHRRYTEEMGRVTVRDLRNRSADVLARVAGGETLTITRDGEPVAEVVPLPRRRLNAEELTARWRNVPQIDANALRAEIDSLLDPSL